MNLIKFKQIEGLTNEFENLEGEDARLFNKIYDVASGDLTFAGEKTFTNEAYFAQDVHLTENISVQGNGHFKKIGVNFPASCHPDQCIDQALHVTGANAFIEDGNLYVSGEFWGTGIDGKPGQIFPTLEYWTVKPDKEIYYDAANVGIGTGNPTFPLHVKGDSKINGNLWVTGDVTGQCFYSTKAGTMLIDSVDALRVSSANGTDIISDAYINTRATGDINISSYGGDINISGLGSPDGVSPNVRIGSTQDIELRSEVLEVYSPNQIYAAKAAPFLTRFTTLNLGSLNFQLEWLPITDPGVSGALWQDVATKQLMISQG